MNILSTARKSGIRYAKLVIISNADIKSFRILNPHPFLYVSPLSVVN